jgi:hypothetical protein
MLVVLNIRISKLPDHTSKRTGPLRRVQNVYGYLINCDSSEDENEAVKVSFSLIKPKFVLIEVSIDISSFKVLVIQYK